MNGDGPIVGTPDELGREGWSAYRWGILKLLEDLKALGEARAKEGRESIAALEAALLQEMREVENRLQRDRREKHRELSSRLSALEDLTARQDRALVAFKVKAAILGAGFGTVFGAIAAAVAARLLR